MGVSPFHYNKDYNTLVMVVTQQFGVSPFHYNKDYNTPSTRKLPTPVYHLSIITRIKTDVHHQTLRRCAGVS